MSRLIDRTRRSSASSEDRPQIPRPPRFASPARGVLHTLISVAGWALFLWWWWIVLQGVGRGPVVFTAVFLVVSLVVVVAINAVWTWHNRRIWEARGPRTKVRVVSEDWSRDRLGREVTFEGSLRRIQTERAVEVVFDDDRKVYRPVTVRSISPSDPAGPLHPTEAA